MTEPRSRRPLEDQLETALRNAAQRAVPDDRPVPQYPRALFERDRRRARRRWLVPAVGVAGAALVALVAVTAVTHDDSSTPPATHISPVPGPASPSPYPSTPPATSSAPAPAALTGAWTLLPAGPLSVDAVVWDGTEVIVNRGGCCADPGSEDFAAYNPATHAWRTLPKAPLSARSGSVLVWTGTELIVTGGYLTDPKTGIAGPPARDGAAWDRATNTWHTIASAPVPLPAGEHRYDAGSLATAWTGTEMLVWTSSAGVRSDDPSIRQQAREVVLAYNPVTNSWRSLPGSPLRPRDGALTVWTGSELVVWGGRAAETYETTTGPQHGPTLSDGARLDPTSGTWRTLPPAPLKARDETTAVWSGTEMLFWGGRDTNEDIIGQGGAYTPATNSWRALPPSPLRAKADPATAWTGQYFLVIGGFNGIFPVPGPGSAAYDPDTGSWTALPSPPDFPSVPNPTPMPADQRDRATALWDGHEALVLGGHGIYDQGARSDGLVWTPADS